MVELGQVSLRINIETQMFKYLQRKPFANENCNLGKAFNKEVVPNKKSGWSIKMRHILDSYGMTNFILNTFKELKDKLDKKTKNKCSFSPKIAEDCCKQTLLHTYKTEKNIKKNMKIETN